MSTPAMDVLRVERGHAAPEEIAAVTVLLLALAAEAEPPADRPPAVRWQRLERRAVFGSPRSWRY